MVVISRVAANVLVLSVAFEAENPVSICAKIFYVPSGVAAVDHLSVKAVGVTCQDFTGPGHQLLLRPYYHGRSPHDQNQ